jgi:hypothetical protein
VVLLMLGLLCACGRPPVENTSNSEPQKLPFDRQPRSSGISPSQTVIPLTTKLPEGTPIPIRLQSGLSSATSHAGDTFTATIDEPIIVDGETLIAVGAPVTGRVLEAKPSTSSRGRPSGRSAGSTAGSSPGSSPDPGYMRIVLVSLEVGGRSFMIETSSIFAKGGTREERNSAAGAASIDSRRNRKDRDIVFGVDRRLDFRLAQSVDLQ